MKLTKAKLKQIIKEEMSDMLETDMDKYAARAQSTPAAVEAGALGWAPGLGGITTEPRHDDPYEAFWNKLLIRHKLDRLSPEEGAERLGLGGDEEVIEFIRTLQADKSYEPTFQGGADPAQKVSYFRDEPQL